MLFNTFSELPLYLLLGILCGLVSVTFSACTSFALEMVDSFERTTGLTKAILPAFGGLTVGLLALAHPEVLYWGFENVDILLESQPFVNGLPATTLFQLVGVKILATSLSRASGLVGGYYAPSLFIGAATGMAYGKFVKSALCGPNPLFHLSILEVASPQAYGLVGMAATLAGVCQVPLTSVLLLFELTQDYRIVLPLLGAVGLLSWIASSQPRKRDFENKLNSVEAQGSIRQPLNDLLYRSQETNDSKVSSEIFDTTELCKLETSLCMVEESVGVNNMEESLTVSQAMRTKYVTVSMSTSVVEAVTLMLMERQYCAVIIDRNDFLVGLLVLEDIQNFCRVTRPTDTDIEVDEILVSHISRLRGNNCQLWTATPDTTLVAAERIMDTHGVNDLPVVSGHNDRHKRGHLIGLLDRECISIAYRAAAGREHCNN